MPSVHVEVLCMLKIATSRGRDFPPQGSHDDSTHSHELDLDAEFFPRVSACFSTGLIS